MKLACFWIIACFMMVLLGPHQLNAQENRVPTVGAAGNIEQLVLPGSELSGKPLQEADPIVVRVLQAFPHGDSFRYDIRFYGMEPGKYNLSEWMVRKDGSSTVDLPEVNVEVQSLLPPGQIEPNELESGWLPKLGGYRRVLIVTVVLWCLVLVCLVFSGRKKPEKVDEPEHQLTLADLLENRLEAAIENRMDPAQYAELERMLFAFWQKRLGLENEPTDKAMALIKKNGDAGPLMNQLEQWLHNPHASKDVDLAVLLKPFRHLPADTPGFET
jgi:hypothetical protein